MDDTRAKSLSNELPWPFFEKTRNKIEAISYADQLRNLPGMAQLFAQLKSDILMCRYFTLSTGLCAGVVNRDTTGIWQQRVAQRRSADAL